MRVTIDAIKAVMHIPHNVMRKLKIMHYAPYCIFSNAIV